MSSLLEQAIVDAQALREAALKSAEAAVAEKYSEEIKTIVEDLISEELGDLDISEQEAELDPAASPEEEVPLGGEDKVTPAALDGEQACPCPDDVAGDGSEREIEIDLDQLAGMSNAEPLGAGEPQEPVEDVADELPLQEDASEEEAVTESEDETLDESEEDPIEEDQEVDLNLDEDIEISAEDIMGLLEDLDINVDLEAVGRGWAGQSRAESEEQIHQNLAALKDTEKGEERKELLKKISELEESIKRSESASVEYKTLAENLAEKLEAVNLANAKLLYINKTLGTPSLNERQTQNIVEAISKAGTAEEAKVIFETLQSTVGAASNRETLPQSLSEAVNRKGPSMLVSRPRRSEQGNDNVMQNFAERMRKLAGIDRT